MRALILGGSRFIGRRLADALLEAGHSVTLFNRGRTGDGLGDRVRRLAGDRGSDRDLSRTLDGLTFDAAWDFLCYDADDARLAVAHLGGRVGRLVHISTGSVYWCTGDFPCPVPEEEFARHGDFAERPGSIEYAYGYAKRKAEEVLMEAHRGGKLAVTIVRPPVVAGEDEPALRYASYCHRLEDGLPLILPDGGFTPFRHVYADDLAGALARIPELPGTAGRAYNLASPEILSVRRLTIDIAALLRRTPDLVEVPMPVLAALAPDEPEPAAFSPFTQRAPQIPAIDRAIRELDWSPTPYPVWLESVVRWWVDEGKPAGLVPPQMKHRPKEVAMAAEYRKRLGY